MYEKTLTGDEKTDLKLEKYSIKLNISVDDLIERYVKRGLYMDDYYRQPKLSKEKILEIFGLDEWPVD